MNKRYILGALGAAALATSAVILSGCAAQKVESYAAEKPVLDLQQYFNGTLDGYGVFTDRSGTVVKRFSVVVQGSWTGDEGVLDEAFSYSDGSTQKRVWHLTRLPNGRLTGRADDVVGEALGEAAGNAVHWNYTLSLPVDGKVYAVQMDDWMYLMTDKVMLNKTTMTKFGVRMGEVTLSFFKR